MSKAKCSLYHLLCCQPGPHPVASYLDCCSSLLTGLLSLLLKILSWLLIEQNWEPLEYPLKLCLIGLPTLPIPPEALTSSFTTLTLQQHWFLLFLEHIIHSCESGLLFRNVPPDSHMPHTPSFFRFLWRGLCRLPCVKAGCHRILLSPSLLPCSIFLLSS